MYRRFEDADDDDLLALHLAQLRYERRQRIELLLKHLGQVRLNVGSFRLTPADYVLVVVDAEQEKAAKRVGKGADAGTEPWRLRQLPLSLNEEILAMIYELP